MTLSAGTAYIDLVANAASFQKSASTAVTKTSSSLKSKLSGFAKGVGVVAGGLFAVSFAKSALGAADEALKSTNRLSLAAAKVPTVSVDTLNEKFGDLSSKLAIDDDHLKDIASTLLSTGFKGNTEGLTAQVVAIEDIAAATGKSEGLVTKFFSTLNSGNVAGAITKAKTLGLVTEQEADAMTKAAAAGKGAAVQQKLVTLATTKDIGAREAQATATERSSVLWEELQETIGTLILKGLTPLLELFSSVLNFLLSNPPAFIALGVAIGAVTVALVANNIATAIASEEGIVYAATLVAKTAAHIAGTAATVAATAAQWLWNAAISANPLGLIIIAIVAVIAIIVVLVKKFHLADNIMNILKKTVSVVWGAIQAVIKVVVAAVTGYIKAWIAVIKFVINVVKTIVGAVAHAFTGAYNAVRTWLGKAGEFIHKVWDGIIGFFGGLGSKLAKAGSTMWNWLVEGAKAAVNGVINLLNAGIDFINKFQIHIHIDPPGPGEINFDFDGPGIPNIPTLGKGGIVTGPTLALIGEHGPEAVIPLSGRNSGPLQLVGTLDSPWGPVTVRGMILDELDRHDAFTERRGRMNR